VTCPQGPCRNIGASVTICASPALRSDLGKGPTSRLGLFNIEDDPASDEKDERHRQ
jgi:hypothetical protein